MKKELIKYFFCFICLLFCFISCTTNLPATFGKPRKIVLLTNYREKIENQIKAILEQNIYTVQPEPEFLIKYEPLENIAPFLKFHLIFIIGTIDEEPINTLINKYQAKIKSDTFGLFAFSEPWAKGQKVLVFAATSHELLETGLKRYAPRIQKTFQEYLLTYMTQITYERGYDKRLTKQLSDNYNYILKIPNGFKINLKYEPDGFIYLVGHNPERSIFLYTQAQELELTRSRLIAFRDSLTMRFYDGDFVYQLLTRAETTLFNNVVAMKLIGVWQNNEIIVGGPFISYGFNNNHQFYFIDGVLFNPGKKKLDNLNQLDAIIHTFKIGEKN